MNDLFSVYMCVSAYMCILYKHLLASPKVSFHSSFYLTFQYHFTYLTTLSCLKYFFQALWMHTHLVLLLFYWLFWLSQLAPFSHSDLYMPFIYTHFLDELTQPYIIKPPKHVLNTNFYCWHLALPWTLITSTWPSKNLKFHM